MTRMSLGLSVKIKVVLTLVCLLLGAAAFAQTAKSTDASDASLAGTWKMTSETPDGDSVPWTLTISQADGHWTGTVSSSEGQMTPASNFKVSGNKVHLQTQYQGGSYDIDLTLAAGALAGTWSGDNGSGKTTGKRSS